MRITVVVDADLLHQAHEATGLKTSKEVVEAGLAILLQKHGQGDVQYKLGPRPNIESLDELWCNHLTERTD